MGEATHIFVSLFNRGQLLKEQILSFKSRAHVKELHHLMKQTSRIHSFQLVNITLFLEKRQGVFIRVGGGRY